MEEYLMQIQRRKEERRLRRQRRRRRKILIISSILIILIGLGVFFFYQYQSQHFRKGTIINTVDCSNLTVDDAFQKINEYISSQKITYLFIDGTVIEPSSSYSIALESKTELSEILEQQNQGEKRQVYSLTNVSLDENKLKEHLLSIEYLDEANMKQPQNAYLEFGDDNLFHIVPEVLGNVIDFKAAYQLAIDTLKSGNTTIDFRSITKTLPEIISTNQQLVTAKEELNKVFSTVINYILPDGSNFTLDFNTFTDWLTQDDNGMYHFELEDFLEAFMDILEDKINENNSYVSFNATDIGPVSVYLPKSKRATLNREAEIAQIKENFGTIQNRSPIYEQSAYTLADKNSYVEIDITRQHVWMYKDGTCIVDTPCVTGNASNHNTPSGVFKLTYKTTDTYLKGYNDDGSRYNSHVNYWMPFNGGIGMHDALWRDADEFGGTTYKGNGSHGCVNLPLAAAEIIYNHIDNTMPIIVYAS